MMTGIVSEGKVGDRAFGITEKTSPIAWIMVPFSKSSRLDDPGLTFPVCVSPAEGARVKTCA
jgi:hypothetical protein